MGTEMSLWLRQSDGGAPAPSTNQRRQERAIQPMMQESDPFERHGMMMQSMMGGGLLGGGLLGGSLLGRMMAMPGDDDDGMFGGGMMGGGLGGGSFSMSSFSSSSMGGGTPHVVQYSSSTTVGPGGVRQTQKTSSDSRTGDQRMQMERSIGDKGRRVTKSRN